MSNEKKYLYMVQARRLGGFPWLTMAIFDNLQSAKLSFGKHVIATNNNPHRDKVEGKIIRVPLQNEEVFENKEWVKHIVHTDRI